MNPLVSRFLARGGRKRGNRQTVRETEERHTNEPSTVTLAAHVLQRLTIKLYNTCDLGLALIQWSATQR